MSLESAIELADSYFNFDYLGDAMMNVRRELDNVKLQEDLAAELTDIMCENEGDDDREVFAQAAKAREEQYVASAKSAKGKGCGK